MGKILGGSQTSSVEMPQWLQQASQDAIAQSRETGRIGAITNELPQLAAFNPMQVQAMQNTASGLAAYGGAPAGMDVMAGMPPPQEFAGGIMGYSAAPLVEEAIAKFQEKNPMQAALYNQQFVQRGMPQEGATPTDMAAIDPNTGIPYAFSINPATGQPYFMDNYRGGFPV